MSDTTSGRKFTLTISTSNDAFGNDATEQAWEVARILTSQIEKLREGHVRGDCFDINGNNVGEWVLDYSDPTATGRSEDEPCERGTVGCSIAHTHDTPCATW